MGVLLVAGCASFLDVTPNSVKASRKARSVPLWVIADLPVVPVYVNGRGPYPMVVDTGAETMALSRRLVGSLGLGVSHVFGSVSAMDQKTPVGLVGATHVEHVRVGSTRFWGVDALVFDWFERTGLDGVIPLRFFQSVLVTLDYPGGRLVVEPGGLPPEDGKTVFALGGNGRLLPSVDASLCGEHVSLSIDTGAYFSVTVPERGGCAFETPPATVAGLSVAGPHPHSVGRAAGDLEVAGHTLRRPLVWLGERGHATLGSRALRPFVVTFDMRQGRIRMRGPAESPVDPPLLEHGFDITLRGGRVTVHHVQPASPAAEAGLRPGDRLVAVQGRSLEAWKGQELAFIQMWTGPAPLDLVIERDGGRRVTLRVPKNPVVP